ncbi:hypothetical protein CAL29_00360 [Bordetella genomosp. 10]|uniref:LacI family transcriptional regulator n=1 Tax=Bordetella genomosp. 10 TaxID=1416804 RepID=A0A261SKS1_9BORD|nr:tripartite tricarboxylate transporter substrate-binding protein [Bordetella genomosp. 10]OZI36933.1 hypothetical protein CAL29_00360 [Bordetella genomosp. 10]
MKNLLLAISATAIVTAAPLGAQAADDYPSKPITMLIGFAPGGGSDIVGRVIASHMARTLHTKVIVENKVGAGGGIAAQALTRDQPDGYTIMLSTIGALAVNPHLDTHAGYNPEKDFSCISLAAELPVVIVANTATGLNSLEDLDAALEKTNTLSYGSSGIGSAGHLAGELYKQMRHIQGFTHVPYRGGMPAMNDLLGNNVPILFSAISEVVPHIRGGKIKALAVTSLHRAPLLPEVKTLDESGLAGFNATSWYGFVAPVGTPAPIIDKLNKAIVAALADKKVVEVMSRSGMTPLPSSPKEMQDYMTSESEKWGKLIEDAHIRP